MLFSSECSLARKPGPLNSADLDSQLREVDGNAWIESLEKAMALKSLWLFDAHGIIVSGEVNVKTVLSNKLAFLVSLQERIFEMADSAVKMGYF